MDNQRIPNNHSSDSSGGCGPVSNNSDDHRISKTSSNAVQRNVMTSQNQRNGGSSTSGRHHQRIKRMKSQWEVIEGLKSGQRCTEKPTAYAGFMWVRRKWPMKGWRRRFCSLDEGQLTVSKNHSDFEKGKIRSSIDIGMCVISVRRDDRKMDIDTESFVYHFYVKDSYQFERWLEQLKAHRLYRQDEISYGGSNKALHPFAPITGSPIAGPGLVHSPDMQDLHQQAIAMEEVKPGIPLTMRAMERRMSSTNSPSTPQTRVANWVEQSLMNGGGKEELSSAQGLLFELATYLQELEKLQEQANACNSYPVSPDTTPKQNRRNKIRFSFPKKRASKLIQPEVQSAAATECAAINHNQLSPTDPIGPALSNSSSSPEICQMDPATQVSSAPPPPPERQPSVPVMERKSTNASHGLPQVSIDANQHEVWLRDEFVRVAQQMHTLFRTLFKSAQTDRERLMLAVDQMTGVARGSPSPHGMSDGSYVSQLALENSELRATLAKINSLSSYSCDVSTTAAIIGRNDQMSSRNDYFPDSPALTHHGIRRSLDRNTFSRIVVSSNGVDHGCKGTPDRFNHTPILTPPLQFTPHTLMTTARQLGNRLFSGQQRALRTAVALVEPPLLSGATSYATGFNSLDSPSGAVDRLGVFFNCGGQPTEESSPSRTHLASVSLFSVQSEYHDALDKLSEHSSEYDDDEEEEEEEPITDESDDDEKVKVGDGSSMGTTSPRSGRRVKSALISVDLPGYGRERLPSPMSDSNGFSLANFLWKNIGKDLSRIAMPVVIHEPLSALQVLCEELHYSELLDQVAEADDPNYRMLLVAIFGASCYASTFYRAERKPFNPLLGETFEYDRPDKGWRYVAEQVSHHPPISSCHAEGRQWIWWQEARARVRFWGKSMEVQPLSTVQVEFPKFKESYSWNKVTTSVHNLIGGNRWVDQYGEMTVTCSQTKTLCKLMFQKTGKNGADKKHEVKGFVYDARGTEVHEIFGTWSQGLYLGPASVPRCLWRPDPMPVEHDLYYGFTHFAMQLNDIPRHLTALLPRTDSRFRPDQRFLEDGLINEADKTKMECESSQRERRKARDDRGERFLPNWFSEEKWSSGKCWRSGGNYWVARDRKFSGIEFEPLW